MANFGKAVYRSLERSTQDTRDGFFFVQCSGLIFLAARWFGPATSASTFLAFLDDILRVCQSLRDSLFYLGKLHWFLYRLLSYYYNPGMFIFCWSANFVEKVVLNESMASEMASLVSFLICYNCIWVNLKKSPRNFVGAIRTTITKCRVSFIDSYLVFPTNFRIVFLPHTNTVILLERYCGTITEPGLPVLGPTVPYLKISLISCFLRYSWLARLVGSPFFNCSQTNGNATL